jgi:hypothetical protein
MKTAHKIFASLLVAAALTAPAGANNAVVHYTLVLDQPGYEGVQCLDILEPLEFIWTIQGTTHEVVTPSGGYHLVDHWVVSGFVVGQNTGREWTHTSGVPLVINQHGAASTFTGVTQITLQPITAGAPKAMGKGLFHVTTNANGVETASIAIDSAGQWRCVFPKN